MLTKNRKIELETNKQFEIVDITEKVAEVLDASGVKNGMVLVFSNHTTAAIRMNHNEPLLMQDVMKALYRLVPVDVSYAHDVFEMRENVSVGERTNGHAHVKAFILGSSECIPVLEGKLHLGDRQSIFFVDFDGGRKRDYTVQVVGE